MEFKDIYYQGKPNKSYVYFEFIIRFDERTGIDGRVVFELFDDVVPKTAANFKALCTGVNGNSPEGVPLNYGKMQCPFHRVLNGFAIQGGDIENGDGTGGYSIYGPTFEDENFNLSHNAPFLLSMANKGPNTNNSQFFITLSPAEHLDGDYVVFGKVISGKSYLRALESVAVDDNGRPLYPTMIKKTGVLPSGKPMRVRPFDDGTGDLFEKYIHDERLVDISDPKSVFKVVEAIKEIGTKQFKKGNNLKALEKYRKASNYLEDYYPDDLDAADHKTLKDLKVSLFLNVALTSIKLGVGDTAIKAATEALGIAKLAPKEKAKAYYRRANGYMLVKNEEEAIEDLKAAHMSVPDRAIFSLTRKAYEARAKRMQLQETALSNLFKNTKMQEVQHGQDFLITRDDVDFEIVENL